jgi:hypothetical protein
MTDGIFWHAPAEFCWRGSFAGVTFASKTAPETFQMCQQNFRCTSKIINSLSAMDGRDHPFLN